MGVLYTVYPPLGLLYIASVLIENKHNVSIIDADIDDLSLEDIKQQIKIHSPDVVGITSNTFQIKSAFETANAVKYIDSSIIVILGGPHPSIVQKEIFDTCKAIDIAVIGEGELTMVEILQAIEKNDNFSEIKGISYKDNGEIKINPPREFIDDLDTLPFPALELVMPIERYPGPRPTGAKPTIQIMASRGCPFKCTFCSNPVWGNTVRHRSPESIIGEINWLYTKFNVKEIFFQDDTFNLNREWFEKICHGIINNGFNDKILFKSPFRVNKKLVDEDILKLARKAGFWMIFYGVESGNQDMLNITQKGTTLKEIERAFKLTKKAGIKALASFMIGNINETPETIKDTIDFAKKIDPDYFGFAIATPYPGSEFYNTAKERGYLQVNDYSKYDLTKYILKTEYLSETEVENFAHYATLSVNKYQESLIRKIKKIVGLFYKLGFKRILWDVKGESINNLDYLPIYSADVKHSFLEQSLIMGITDYCSLGHGWHSLENWPPAIRWTSLKASAYLKSDQTFKKVFIKAITHYPNINAKISIDKQFIKAFSFNDTEWNVLEIDLPDFDTNIIEVLFEVDKTWIPDEIMKNGDTRELGIAVHKIWLE